MGVCSAIERRFRRRFAVRPPAGQARKAAEDGFASVDVSVARWSCRQGHIRAPAVVLKPSRYLRCGFAVDRFV